MANKTANYWKSLLASDANEVSKRIKRWSLQSLSNLAEESDSPSSTSHFLLEDVAYRLARQHTYVSDIVSVFTNDQGNNHQSTLIRQHLKRLDTLQYVHFDTYKLCKQMLLDEREPFWNRFEKSDQFVINSIMEQTRSRHANTMEAIADLVTAVRNEPNVEDDINYHKFFTILHAYADRFLQGRLGIQLLCDHYVKLYRSNYQSTGAVALNSTIQNDVLVDAITESKHMCDAHLQTYAEVDVQVPNGHDPTQTIIRSWIHHSLVELLKNSMASSVKQVTENSLGQKQVPHSSSIPPVVTRLTELETSLVIEIVDRGTGFTTVNEEEAIYTAFLLGHSNSGKKWDRLDEQQSYAAVRSPLSSLGVGLHSSRCMIEHFGGSLTLRNNRNDGTNVSDDNISISGRGIGCTARIELPKDITLLERIPGIDVALDRD
jgi:pyruvate dehydrogenase kinase 2/3/4